MTYKPWRKFGTFARDLRGSFALKAALTFPVLLVAVGAAVDSANLVSQKSNLQNIADSAAIASARELRLGNTKPDIVNAVAQSVAQASLAASPLAADTSTRADVLEQGRAVMVTLNQPVPRLMGALLSTGPSVISASATARISGNSAICVLALNGSAKKSLEADQNALLTGRDCALYSNSTAANSIIAKGGAKITAKLICSAGGIAGDTNGLSPTPTTDCPQIRDPLAARPAPAVGACNETNLVVSTGTQTLNPGVYCGGLRITGGAKVYANPGVFVIKDGTLTVDSDSTLVANNAGFFLTGTNAVLNFTAGANTINLTAPIDGPMAGLLVFEDRSNTPGQSHSIQSDDARTLLGTIYLPRGVLSIGSKSRVADQSAYTVIVADSVVLTGGPNMVLNANYGATNVPVPDGLGPHAVALRQ